MNHPERHHTEIGRLLNPDDGVSLEGIQLLNLASGNPEAYWPDVMAWTKSDDSIRAAEGNLIAGALCRFGEPARAVAYFEEARRLFVDRNYYDQAATMTRILVLLYEHELGDQAAAEFHHDLIEGYRADAEKHPRLRQEIMDDDD